MPFVIQSGVTGHFLTPNPDDGQPEWVMLLRDACPIDDLETCVQIIEDHVDFGSLPTVVDLTSLHSYFG